MRRSEGIHQDQAAVDAPYELGFMKDKQLLDLLRSCKRI
jgi:hypothetical protein